VRLIDNVKEALGLDAPLAAFRSKLVNLEAQHAALGQERDALLTQSPIRADGHAIAALVAERRAALHTEHPELWHLMPGLAGLITWGPDGRPSYGPPHLPDVLHRLSPCDLLLLLDPTGTAERLRALLPVGDAGARTIPQRLDRITAIDAERARIAGAHEALVDRAHELGVTVPHLADNAARRQSEAATRGREAHRQTEADRDARLRGRS
jgi:hypothetical protein